MGDAAGRASCFPASFATAPTGAFMAFSFCVPGRGLQGPVRLPRPRRARASPGALVFRRLRRALRVPQPLEGLFGIGRCLFTNGCRSLRRRFLHLRGGRSEGLLFPGCRAFISFRRPCGRRCLPRRLSMRGLLNRGRGRCHLPELGLPRLVDIPRDNGDENRGKGLDGNLDVKRIEELPEECLLSVPPPPARGP